MVKKILSITFKIITLNFRRKDPKSLLLVAEYGKSGGTRTYFIQLLKFLHKQGYRVTVLMNAPAVDDEIDSLIASLNFLRLRLNFDFWCIDLENIPSGLSKKDLINYQFKEMNFWCRLLKQNDFATIAFSVAYPEQYLHAFMLPVAIRYILHTAPVKKADQCKIRTLKHFLNKNKQLITVSKASAALIQEYWLNGKESKYNNLVYNFYEPKYKGVIQKKELPKKRVLTIGSVEAYKNPFLFIEVAKKVVASNTTTKVEFTWAGDGSLLQECRNRVQDFPQIQFAGNIENVEELYAASTVYFQPSLQESHGIAVLGAMYHKLPCVVSDRGGLKESVTESLSGFVISVGNETYAVEKISKLLEDGKLSQDMGDNGYKRFSENFTKSIWERSMNNIFKNV